VDRNPAGAVIDNAFRAVAQSDFAAAENLLKRARQLYPADPHWTDLLADLYVSAVVPSWRHSHMAKPELITPPITDRVVRELAASNDAALLQQTGEIASMPENPLLRQVFGPSLGGDAWGERLLARARRLKPNGTLRRQPRPTGPIRFGTPISNADSLLLKVEPTYPAGARIEGSVVITLLIRIDGTVEKLRVVHGHPLLVLSAERAVRQWRYEPTLLNGEPISVIAEVTVNFTLSDDSAATQPPPEAARIRLEAGVLESLLIKRFAPVRCWECRPISGIVRFNVRIGRDGKVVDIQLVSGHPLLVPAAMDAVRQWVYRPTRVNGTTVEVEGQVDVHFPP
jgi:TonB family protein